MLKLNDMTNEEKTMLLLEEVCNDEFGEVIPDKNWTPCNLTCRQVRKKIEYACINIAQWKDEQLESKLMQIIILAQQGYTSGATDEMILKHCKEIINENYERNTTKTD